MILNKCDICGKETFFSPQTEYAEIKNEEGQIVGYETVRLKRQNPSTGDLEEIEIPKLNDLQPRAYKVLIVLGLETVSRDFCLECLNGSGIRARVSELFMELGNIRSR